VAAALVIEPTQVQQPVPQRNPDLPLAQLLLQQSGQLQQRVAN
jgi:hypothetical protein